MSKAICVMNLVLFIGLVGCSVGVNNTSAIFPTETQQVITLLTPPEVSLEPFMNKCIKLDNGFPPVETADHILLLREGRAPYPPFLLNLANGISAPISDNNIIWVYVSPNQEMLAYDTYSRSNLETNKLVIANPTGDVLKIIPTERDWAFFWGWLDNDHLLVTRNAKEGEQAPALVVLGLSDNTRREIPSDYPNFDNINYLSWQHNRVVYDSTLTLALYPSLLGNTNTITLFDVRNRKELAILSADVTRTAQPEWSPAGNYVVVAGAAEQNKADLSENSENHNQELFLISKNGEITRLTNFTEKYDNVRIGSASWSPNGKNIAFWFSVEDSTDEQLATINLDTKEIVNYCVTGINNSLGYSEKPVWSPNNQLLLVNNKENNEGLNRVLWIDIKNLNGAVMESDATIEGWLISQ